MALRNWNPREPYVLGLEWPGMRATAVPLTQEAEYGYTFQANATETIDTASFPIVQPEVSPYSVSTGLVTVYEDGDEASWAAITTTTCLVNGGALAGAAALVGAASITAAMASSADGGYISIPNAGIDEVRLEFATASLFIGKRILEVRLRYVATRTSDVADDVPSLKLIVGTAGNLGLVGKIAVDPYAPSSSPLRTVSFGEVNYALAGTEAWPYTVADVDLFDSATLQVRLQATADATAGTTALHYAALDVVWCEENRVAVGATILRQGHDAPTVAQHTVHLRTPAGVDNWAKVADAYYAVTVTSARSPGPFLDAVTDVAALTMKQTQGEPPSVALVDSFAVFSGHEGRVAPRGAAGTAALISQGVDSRISPISFLTAAAAATTDAAVYDAAFGAPYYNGSDSMRQEIAQRSGGGTVLYPWVRFYVRVLGDLDDADDMLVDTSLALGAITVTVAEIMAEPEIYDGWREMTRRFAAGQEPGLDNTGTDILVIFTSTDGDVGNRFEVLGLDSTRAVGGVSGASTYGTGSTSHYVTASARIYKDLAVTLHTEAPDVAGYSTDLLTVALAYEDSCVDACQVPSLKIVRVNFTASSLAAADFGYYEIQRKDTYDATWRTVAKLVTVGLTSWADNEMRRGGVTSDYRMRIVRADGIEGAWSATSSEVVSDDADTPAGTMYFTSNSGNAAIAYGTLFDGVPEETFTFVEAGDVVTQRMYGRFGTQAFHPTERGGIAFERTLLVNQLAATPNALLQTAWDALRDLAWADIPYVCVTDEIGNRWFGTLVVPDGVFIRAPGIHMASIRFIESTQEPFPDSGV